MQLWGVISDVKSPVVTACYAHGLGEEMDKALGGKTTEKLGFLSKYLGEKDFL